MANTRHNHKQGMTNRTRMALVLLCIGLIGLGIVIMFMRMRAEAADALSTYASQGTVYNLTEIFHIPALMFFAVVVLYALSELVKSFRAMSDPETYRKQRATSRAGVQVGRKAKREKVRQSKTLAAQSRRYLSDQSASKAPRRITDQSRDVSVGITTNQIGSPTTKRGSRTRTRNRS